MHLASYRWWIYASARWPEYFTQAKVVEFGSYNINGTIRPLFVDCAYLGIDWREGPGVDQVGLFHKIREQKLYPVDAVVSASTLEHDPFWSLSLSKAASLLGEQGALFMTWGCAANARHCAPECPDYAEAKRWGKHLKLHHARPVWEVLELLPKIGLHVQEFRYEDGFAFNRGLHEGEVLPGCKKRITPRQLPLASDHIGCLVAFADPKRVKEPYVDELRPDDRRLGS